jgi:uncharacterized protein YabE (DUF348 family)
MISLYWPYEPKGHKGARRIFHSEKSRWLFLLIPALLLSSCQTIKIPVTILADGQIHNLFATTRLPADLLARAGVTLGTNDRLLYLGSSIPLDTTLPVAKSYTITVRRAVALTVVAPDGQQTIQTSALTVGQGLAEAGYTLHAADLIDPPAETPITGPMTVIYQPSYEIVVTVDGTQVRVRSAAATVGQALAEAGVPLVGLDTSVPVESAALPEDGQIRVVRVVESVALTQKTIPFNTRTELSADLELDQQALLQGGEPGLAIARLRTRSEDGVQVSQQSESESVVRPPQDRILGIGTKIVIRTTSVDGVTIEYWRALNLFATYYVPCIPGTNICHYGTASGKSVQKGVVAMVYPWYLLFAGEPLYIPGYGFATVEDNNGAYTSAYGDTYWIDLGYSETDTVNWDNHYVIVYFLTPVPVNPGYILP